MPRYWFHYYKTSFVTGGVLAGPGGNYILQNPGAVPMRFTSTAGHTIPSGLNLVFDTKL